MTTAVPARTTKPCTPSPTPAIATIDVCAYGPGKRGRGVRPLSRLFENVPWWS
jgi:hypothetical protein